MATGVITDAEAQGYLMAKPMPSGEFLKLLERGVVVPPAVALRA